MQFSGILELDPKQYGFIRQLSTTVIESKEDVIIPAALIEQHKLREGVFLEGSATAAPKGPPVADSISTVAGLPPAEWKTIKEFSRHAAVSPHELIRLEGPKNGNPMRIIDLFCPVGKGQRALIVSPPKAGKTILMGQIAHAISANHPDIELLVLLIDERPEEVTDLKRSIKGEVFASSNDSDKGRHVRLAQLVLEYAKRKVEIGKDVVILLDSLTRLGRAFNSNQKGSGRTLSGGVDIRALEIPKRIFGAARKCEDSGSLTIIATALVDTNSRMDELIFQEFKGTGNMELVLDRDLANERIFPSVNLMASGTRREELLFGAAVGEHQALRRSLSKQGPRDAMLSVLKLTRQFPSNEKLLSKF